MLTDSCFPRPGEIQVLRKELSDTDPNNFEDLSTSIRSGMQALGHDLVDPLGIALDLRDEKARHYTPHTHTYKQEQSTTTASLQWLSCFALVSRKSTACFR